MQPDQLLTQEGLDKFRATFANFGEWIEGQRQNSERGLVNIVLKQVVEVVSDFLVATRNMRMLETDETKKSQFSQMEAQLEEALGRLTTITDLYEQVSVYIPAKKLLLQVHSDAKKLLML